MSLGSLFSHFSLVLLSCSLAEASRPVNWIVLPMKSKSTSSTSPVTSVDVAPRVITVMLAWLSPRLANVSAAPG